MSVIISDKMGRTDSAYNTLINKIDSTYPIVMVSWAEDYVFNEELLTLKDYVLICYCEYGWDADLEKTGSHIWGINSEKFPRYYNGDWVRFDNWVKSNPRFTVRLKFNLYNQLRIFAEDNGMTINGALRFIISQFFKNRI